MHPLMTSDLPPPADMKNLKERTTKAQTEVPRKPPEKSSSLTLVTADLFKLVFFFKFLSFHPVQQYLLSFT